MVYNNLENRRVTFTFIVTLKLSTVRYSVYYTLRISENFWFFDAFKGYIKHALDWNDLNISLREVSLFGVFLLRIFPHSDWKRTRKTPNTDTWNAAFISYSGNWIPYQLDHLTCISLSFSFSLKKWQDMIVNIV